MLGLKCCIIDSLNFLGGQCKALYAQKPIYDIAGFPSIKAERLIKNLIEQAKPFKADTYLNQKCCLIEKKANFWEISTSKGIIQTKTIIVAAGAGTFEPRKPPISNINRYENISAFYHIKDINLFKGKIITIAGGGDSALNWSILLANDIAKKVYLIHRRNNFRASPKTVEKITHLSKNGSIKLITPYQLYKLKGNDGLLKEIEVKDLDKNTLKFKSDYLLLFFGMSMNIGPISNWNLPMHNKHIEVNPATMETNLNGVFAIGDICNYPGKMKLILTGFAECARACHSAYNYINPTTPIHFEHSTTKGLPANI